MSIDHNAGNKWKVFLARAKELADRLLPAFATSTGLPYKMVIPADFAA